MIIGANAPVRSGILATVSSTLLAFHAHPDDESSKGAGTVARYATAGVRCVLVTATGGEAGDILNPAMDHPEVQADLAAVRRRELARATEILGYHRVEMLGFRDSGMPGSEHNGHGDAFVNQPMAAVLEPLVRIIRDEQPEVMLGYDTSKWYPHPDHLLVHELSLAAFDAAADGNRFPEAGRPWQVSKLYAPTFTRERIEMLHTAMVERGLESPFTERLLSRGGERQAPTAQIDVSDFVSTARGALRAHATQVDPEGFWFHIPEEVVRQVYPHEDFVLLASRVEVTPPEDDLFAGIG